MCLGHVVAQVVLSPVDLVTDLTSLRLGLVEVPKMPVGIGLIAGGVSTDQAKVFLASPGYSLGLPLCQENKIHMRFILSRTIIFLVNFKN